MKRVLPSRALMVSVLSVILAAKPKPLCRFGPVEISDSTCGRGPLTVTSMRPSMRVEKFAFAVALAIPTCGNAAVHLPDDALSFVGYVPQDGLHSFVGSNSVRTSGCVVEAQGGYDGHPDPPVELWRCSYNMGNSAFWCPETEEGNRSLMDSFNDPSLSKIALSHQCNSACTSANCWPQLSALSPERSPHYPRSDVSETSSWVAFAAGFLMIGLSLVRQGHARRSFV